MTDSPATAKIAVAAATYWVDRPFDYRIPPALADKVVPGVRVVVPFGGGNRRTEGIVLSLGTAQPGMRLKSIASVLDASPVLSPEMIRLAVWLRERYFCTVYDAVHAMLPAGLWYQMESVYTLCAGFDRESAYTAAGKSAQEQLVLDAVFAHGGSCPLVDLERLFENVSPARALQSLVRKGVLETDSREKRRAGMPNFGITHVFLAAYVRCVAKYPALNRFLSGQQVYSRDNDIQFCMMVKEDMTTEAPESAMKLHLRPTDTVEDIYRKFNAEVDRIKDNSSASDFDKTAKALSLIPGVFFKFVIWVLKTMDYFGLLPKFLLEVSPFHASIFFTSMGSLGIPPIVHHLYDFGNMPVFVAFGCKYHKNEVLDDGTVVRRKYIDYTVNTDERICDGFYYATTLKHLKRLLSHPEQLDKPAPVVNHDIE